MWVIGVILIAVGIGLFFYKKKIDDKLMNLKYFDLTDIKSVLDTCLGISKELGTGHFSQMVKVKAKAFSEEPINGVFSKLPCVYYQASVTHKFEKLIEVKDSNNKSSYKWVEDSEMLGNTKEGGKFLVDDNTEKVLIDIDGADLTITRAVNRYVPSNNSVSFEFATYNPVISRDKKSLGYSENENNITVGTELFIVGEFHDRNGTPTITKPQNSENPFVVSIHSEEKVLSNLESKSKNTFYASIACLVIGAILVVVGFVQ